ncbi:MAG: rhodanese-related sulfurtransferase [Bacteroidetes bacterium]|nr:rhodanese-related sulfurtransferase [Bacteroidota bacterium]
MAKHLLHNKYSREDLRKMLEQESDHRTVISFYQYAKIEDPLAFRNEMYARWEKLGVLGRVYVAKEGVNGQISLPTHNYYDFKDDLYKVDFLNGIRLNVAVEQKDDAFFKLKVKVREKIVADGLDDSTFDVTNKGKHLSAQEFNELTNKPETILIDMRNHYESEVGHMKGAYCPDVDTFREELPLVVDKFKEDKDKHVVMYCTGGIRCEKASAYLKHVGFENVYQLNGGIIEYTRQCNEEGIENKFVGKNFVFDERLGERISDEVIAECHQCGKPCDDHTNCANDACHLLFIQCDECKEKYQGCCSTECTDFIQLPEEKQKELRKGMKAQVHHYKKGRVRPKLKELLIDKLAEANTNL